MVKVETMRELLQELICDIFGHKYYVYAKPKESWENGIRWLKCHRCHGDFGINDRVRVLLPMDFEMQDMHEWERTTGGKR